MRYCSLKNQAFWLVQRFFDKKFFSQICSFCRKPLLLSYPSKSVHVNGPYFCPNPHKLILRAFWRLFMSSWPDRTLFKKLDFINFLTLWPPNLMLKIRNNWRANSEILQCKTMDRAEFTVKLLLAWMSQN